jgi:uncharacterized protein involved in exopolysaccharide biosynthesis
LGTYYSQILCTALQTVWRRKLTIVSTVAAVLSLGVTAALVMPKQYTADAFVHGGFAAPDLVSAAEAHSSAVGFDASQLVETQSRLLQSRQLALLVVDRIGLERLAPSHANPFLDWLRAKLHGEAAGSSEYQKDKAAANLLRGLRIRTEPRVYSIMVRYTAGDSAFAALVVNTFVAEFVREIELQKLSEQQAAAKSTLSSKSQTFGEKHPEVRQAQVRLAAAEDLLRIEGDKKPEEILRDAGERITIAQPDAVPSSPNPPVLILLSLIVGVVAGLVLALYLPESATQGEGRSVSPEGVNPS